MVRPKPNREPSPDFRRTTAPKEDGVQMFTTDQQQFAAAIEQFCAEALRHRRTARAAHRRRTAVQQPRATARLAELGWLGVSLPVEYGGGGAGMVEECIFLEETARGLAPIHAYGTGLTAAQTYLRHGDRAAEERGPGQLVQRPLRGDRAFRARRGIRPGRRCAPGRCATATGSSSTVRRPGSPPPTSPTTCWCSPAPTRRSESTKA